MGSSATTLASGAPNLGSQPVAHAASRGYNVAIGYLRGFLVILVLAHHSAVAYFWGVPTSRAPLLKTPMLWRAFPIVDPIRIRRSSPFSSASMTPFSWR
jgi:hypothetical protein